VLKHWATHHRIVQSTTGGACVFIASGRKKVNDCIAAVCRPANCGNVFIRGPCVALSQNEVRDWLAGSRRPAVHRKDQLIRGKNVPTNEKWPIDPKKQKKHNRDILKKLNSRDAKTLMSLQGIGPKTACMIMACCFMRGEAFRFESIQDLRKVRGLGEAFVKKFKKFACQ
jgi:hypothetical protein